MPPLDEQNLDAPEAPPIDSQPDDLAGDAVVEAPAPEIAAEPESVLDAVSKAVKKQDEEVIVDAPPVAPLASEDADRARVESLYQIPPGLKGQERKAYKALSDHARELESRATETITERDQVSQRLNGFESILQDAGATPEVLSGHLQYMRMIKGGDYDKAMQWLDGERLALARAIGKPVEGVDLLAEFPDLKEDVDSFQITNERALELANARRMQNAHQQRQTAAEHQQAENARYAEAQRAKEESLDGIDSWLKGLAGTDVDFAAKETIIKEWLAKPSTTQLLTRLPPDGWLDLIKDKYDSVAVPAPLPRVPTPLRPGGSGSGALPSDADLGTVVNRALGRR